MLGTIQKAVHVIGLFSQERPEWGVTEVAAALAAPKSTTHELLASLAECGYLHRTHKGRYRLGEALIPLGYRAVVTSELRDLTQRYLLELSEQFQCSAIVGKLQDYSLLTLNVVGPSVKFVSDSVGTRISAHCSALGKVLLAYANPDDVAAHFKQHGLLPCSTNSISNAPALQRELILTRQRGYGISVGEYVPEMAATAAPLRDRTGAVVAGISLILPSTRFGEQRDATIQSLLTAGRVISKVLGYSEETPLAD